MKEPRISLVAYGVTPELVMVKIPNERGRWMLTHWCVAHIDCPFCGAIAGEPCHNRKAGELLRYSICTHARRRSAAADQMGWAGHRRLPTHKLRINTNDIAEAMADAEEQHV